MKFGKLYIPSGGQEIISAYFWWYDDDENDLLQIGGDTYPYYAIIFSKEFRIPDNDNYIYLDDNNKKIVFNAPGYYNMQIHFEAMTLGSGQDEELRVYYRIYGSGGFYPEYGYIPFKAIRTDDTHFPQAIAQNIIVWVQYAPFSCKFYVSHRRNYEDWAIGLFYITKIK